MTKLTPISNPYPSRGRGWDFPTHQRYGYLGGEDYEVSRGAAVRAPADGQARKVGTVVIIELDDGREIVVRHVYPYGPFPRRVVKEQIVATSGADGGQWPHFEVQLAPDPRGNRKRVSLSGQVAAYRKAEAAADKRAAKSARKRLVKLVAGYLNRRTMTGIPRTAAESNGIPGPVYYARLAGAAKRDGIKGKTRGALEIHYARRAKAS